MKEIFWLSFSGAIGTLIRFGLGEWIRKLIGDHFPFGTLLINWIGVFLMGATIAYFNQYSLQEGSRMMKLAITTGLLGGFTTYSAFNQETLLLIEKKSYFVAFSYLGMTVIGGLILGFCGMWITKRLGS